MRVPLLTQRCSVFFTLCVLAVGCGDEPPASRGPDAGDAHDGGDDHSIEWMTAERAFELVDPFWGSGGDGFGYGGSTPAAQLPVAPMRLGPDTCLNGKAANFSHTSGYHAADPSVFGFSHTRFVGAGVEDYGNLRVLPLADRPEWPPERLCIDQDKEREQAAPGFYGTRLQGEAVDVELTVDAWAGIHRYAFDDGAHLLWDTGAQIGSGGVERAVTSWDGETLTGWVRFGGAYTGRSGAFDTYFEATVTPPPQSVELWTSQGVQEGADHVDDVRSGAWLTFEPGTTVELRVGLSFVDEAQAALHRASLDGRTFDEVRADARAAWLEKLAKIAIPVDADEREARRFYSALYNVWRMPTQWEGLDGRYLGFDRVVHDGSGDDFVYYTDMSLWDTFRTLHPLYELIDQDLERSCLRSLLAMAEQGGSMPRWPAAAGYTNGMLGASADHLFAGGAAKELAGVDYDAAFDLLFAEASLPQPAGIAGGRAGAFPEYVDYGYVPDDLASSSVSRTLEYAYADGSLANLAETLDRPEKAAALRERAGSWKNLWFDETRFLLPRFADGSFDEDLDPTRVFMGNGAFTEGTAWQYRFYAPHDVDALVSLYGPARFEEALERFMDRSSLVEPIPGLSRLLPDTYYWHGNEPDIDSAYLFHAIRRPDRVAYWVDVIREQAYWDGAEALPGNDDGGTLSAWFVFSALGLYPVAGTDRYVTGQPLFRATRIATSAEEPTVFVVEGALECCDGYQLVQPNGSEGMTSVRHGDILGQVLRFERSEPR